MARVSSRTEAACTCWLALTARALLFCAAPGCSKLVQTYVEEAAAAGPPPSKFVCVAGSQQAAFRQHVESDAAWQGGWQRYHRQHAGLELLCKRCLEAMRAEADAWREQQRGQPPPQQQQLAQGARLGGTSGGQRFNVWKQQQEQLEGPEQPPPPDQQLQQVQEQQQQSGGTPNG